MIDLIYVAYSFHDRAQRPRGLVPALVREGFRPLVVFRPGAADTSACSEEGGGDLGPVLVPASEPGYDLLRDLSRSLRGGNRGGSPGGVNRPPESVREIPGWLHEILGFPDRNMLWIRHAVRAGLSAARCSNPRLVYASALPASALIAGRKLARLLDLPFVSEFRDLWVDNPFADYKFGWRRRIDRAWEGSIVRESARVVVVTEPMREALLESHPGINPGKICVVRNGFDPGRLALTGEEVEGRDVPIRRQVRHDCLERDCITADIRGQDRRPVLAHIGHMYGRRSPGALMQAIEAMRVSPGERPPLRLRLIGRISPAFLPMLANGQNEGWVERTGPVAYDESLKEMKAADCLLLLIENGRGAEGIMTGKVFPYLASGRPIIALVPPGGVAADLIRRSGAGAVVDPDDAQGICRALKVWTEGEMPSSSLDERSDILRAHSWPVLASRLANVLREVCGLNE